MKASYAMGQGEVHPVDVPLKEGQLVLTIGDVADKLKLVRQDYMAFTDGKERDWNFVLGPTDVVVFGLIAGHDV